MSQQRRAGGGGRRPIPITDLLAYLRAGHTQAAAARHFGVSRAAIGKRLRTGALVPVRQGEAAPAAPEVAVPVLRQMEGVLADLEVVLRPVVDQARQGEPLSVQDRAVVIRGGEAKGKLIESRVALEERVFQVKGLLKFYHILGDAITQCSESARRELATCMVESARANGFGHLFLPGRPLAHLVGLANREPRGESGSRGLIENQESAPPREGAME